MVREDIVAGLRNAIERGSSIEQAKMSFISAGYPREEVEEASQFIHSDYTLPDIERRDMTTPAPQISSAIQPSKKSFFSRMRKYLKLFLILGIILVVLIIIFIIILFFRDEIIGIFS